MPRYEYRVITAPARGIKAKGIGSAEARLDLIGGIRDTRCALRELRREIRGSTLLALCLVDAQA